MRNIILYTITVMLLAGCATSPTGRSQLMLVSPEQAIVSSKQAYVQTLQPLAKEGKVNQDSQLTARVQYVTGRVIAQAINRFPHTQNWDWAITVIDEPDTVNAWCMAGGKMAIYTGLLQKVNPTDDELAQVMGHEISHALANHTAERMSIALASQVGLIGVTIASRDSNNRGAIVAGSAAAAALAINLPNSRTAEIEADTMGIELAARAGYDPYAAASLWQKMAKVGGSNPPEFLSTHPAPGNRQAALTNLAGKMMPYYLEQHQRPVYQFNSSY